MESALEYSYIIFFSFVTRAGEGGFGRVSMNSPKDLFDLEDTKLNNLAHVEKRILFDYAYKSVKATNIIFKGMVTPTN